MVLKAADALRKGLAEKTWDDPRHAEDLLKRLDEALTQEGLAEQDQLFFRPRQTPIAPFGGSGILPVPQ
jgi:hypothetical protein